MDGTGPNKIRAERSVRPSAKPPTGSEVSYRQRQSLPAPKSPTGSEAPLETIGAEWLGIEAGCFAAHQLRQEQACTGGGLETRHLVTGRQPDVAPAPGTADRRHAVRRARTKASPDLARHRRIADVQHPLRAPDDDVDAPRVDRKIVAHEFEGAADPQRVPMRVDRDLPLDEVDGPFWMRIRRWQQDRVALGADDRQPQPEHLSE